MTLKSETPLSFFNVKCGNKYSFVSLEDKQVMFFTCKKHDFFVYNTKKFQKNIICTQW